MMEEKQNTGNGTLVKVSRVISGVFTPFIIPFGVFLILFLFSYLRIMPVQYKFVVLGIVYSFTILIPLLIIYIYGRINRIPMSELGEQKKRIMPYLLTIISYFFCILMMRRLNIPSYLIGVLLSTLITLMLFTLINFGWKISAHSGGAGIAIGTTVALSAMFDYNPVWWLCLGILIAGIIGSARIIQGKHTLSQVLGGFTVGLVCSLLLLHPLTSAYFRFLLL